MEQDKIDFRNEVKKQLSLFIAKFGVDELYFMIRDVVQEHNKEVEDERQKRNKQKIWTNC